MSFSPLLNEFIEALRCLPGVGPKSAQRIAFHLLQKRRDAATHLAEVILKAMNNIADCQRCQNYAEEELCDLCMDPRRDHHLLCVVESPADVLAVEQTGGYQGLYFVLHGHLSAIDGIGPNDLGMSLFNRRLQNETFNEIILATNPTVEGEATAHYLAQSIKPYGIRTSRIAHGVPMGGELEYIDSTTLARAMASRDAL